MNVSDYQLLTMSAMVAYTKVRTLYAGALESDMFDDPKHKFLAETLPVCETVTDIADRTVPIGGMPYIRNLASHIKDTPFNMRDIPKWMDMLVHHAKRRAVSGLLTAAQSELDSLAVGADVDPLINNFITELVSTYNTKSSRDFRFFDEVVESVMMEISNAGKGLVYDRQHTGFDSLDDFLGGGIPNGVVVLGGMPGTGKTQLALQWEVNLAERMLLNGEPGVAAFVSAEMSMDKLLQRVIQARSGVSICPNMSEDDQELAKSSARWAATLPLAVDDSDVITSAMMLRRLESLYARKGGIREIVIDFAELVVDDDGDEFNQEQRVGSVFVRAKVLSKRYTCPVVVLSQLNRGAESTKTRVPSMSNLRYSRMAEAIADMVGLIYYPQMYEMTGKQVPTPESMPSIPGTSYLIVDKHRNGRKGTIALGWNESCTQWGDAPDVGAYHRSTATEVLGGVFDDDDDLPSLDDA